MLIVIDDKIPYIRGLAEQMGECIYLPGSRITAADVRNADALIVRTRTRCDESLLGGSSVKFVVTATIGYDHIDTAYMQKAGISWTNCPGCNASSVAQYVESSLLLLARQGTVNLSDCTVGVVGVGHVGSLVAARCAALGCSVLRNDPPRQQREGGYFVSLAEIMEQADVVTFHTPLTTAGPYATHYLASRAFFNALRRRPVIVNSARGGVVDEAALLEAIDDNRVRAAVIDTWEGEPSINTTLLRRAAIATPHIAGYSADGKANATQMALQAVASHFNIGCRFSVVPPTLPEGIITATDPAERKLQFYNPERDSEALKARPADFELLRSNYPLRREDR